MVWKTQPGAKDPAIVMELLGQSLEALRTSLPENNNRMSHRTAMLLGVQMLRCVRDFHRIGFVHRDVKPANFAVGCDSTDAAAALPRKGLFLFDFGIAQRYQLADGTHVPPKKETGTLDGTPRYASMNAHHGQTPSRADDVESLLYIVAMFMEGQLPWQRVPSDAKERNASLPMQERQAAMINRIKERKLSLWRKPELLVPSYRSDGAVATCFAKAFTAATTRLRFGQEPPYELIERLLRRAAASPETPSLRPLSSTPTEQEAAERELLVASNALA